LEKKAILQLADGTRYEGVSIGAEGTTSGEICFNTGMTGYQEVFTDPSYHGQILIATNVYIGNYGVDEHESESSKIRIAGFVCRNFSDFFSRALNSSNSPNSDSYSLQKFFENSNLVGISDIDTRSLVNHIRKNGAMNAVISSEYFDKDQLTQSISLNCPNMAGLELASTVSTKSEYYFGEVGGEYKVAVMDFGVKTNILASLKSRNCEVKVFPAKTTFEEILNYKPDGVLLSNGPGDPEPMDYAISTVQRLLETEIPIFGICLGHQVLGIANGMETYKMRFGHRGLNHPVFNLKTRRSEITSQNHGFALDPESFTLAPNVKLTHTNLNDHSVEGIEIINKKAFSVQYHPESNPGPHDSRYLFDQFVEFMS